MSSGSAARRSRVSRSSAQPVRSCSLGACRVTIVCVVWLAPRGSCASSVARARSVRERVSSARAFPDRCSVTTRDLAARHGERPDRERQHRGLRARCADGASDHSVQRAQGDGARAAALTDRAADLERHGARGAHLERGARQRRDGGGRRRGSPGTRSRPGCLRWWASWQALLLRPSSLRQLLLRPSLCAASSSSAFFCAAVFFGPLRRGGFFGRLLGNRFFFCLLLRFDFFLAFPCRPFGDVDRQLDGCARQAIVVGDDERYRVFAGRGIGVRR